MMQSNSGESSSATTPFWKRATTTVTNAVNSLFKPPETRNATNAATETTSLTQGQPKKDYSQLNNGK